MHGNAGSEKRNKRTVSRASIVHLVQACGLGHLRRGLVFFFFFVGGPWGFGLFCLCFVLFCCAFFFFPIQLFSLRVSELMDVSF